LLYAYIYATKTRQVARQQSKRDRATLKSDPIMPTSPCYNTTHACKAIGMN